MLIITRNSSRTRDALVTYILDKLNEQAMVLNTISLLPVSNCVNHKCLGRRTRATPSTKDSEQATSQTMPVMRTPALVFCILQEMLGAFQYHLTDYNMEISPP